ncbi:jasmonate-induced oxygenase 4-like [Magnolia sinica]|uniref:jasmonate-induced oxygenase 4-like n=1 Tax=Magnolia sinica TaxID=86752 RepID=UPI00265B2FF1|nr:jasmonate-induced oxygenase 4-like [Magnolia sinica]
MECLTKWPEPIVRVQSLSESGTRAIPNSYIKPPSERPSLDCVDQTSDINIPAIDLGGLYGNAGEREKTSQIVADACREWGFFQVVNHGVSVELMERIKGAWRDFFHLPLEMKETYSNSPKTYEGYGSRLGVDKTTVLDWGDYFFLNLVPYSIRNMDKWPTFPASLRAIIDEYGNELAKLSEVVTGLLSKSLGMEEESLHDTFGGEEMGMTLRVNYYPKCPEPHLTLGLSAHSDPGALTLLLPDDRVNGLQVRKGDAWVTVKAAPNSFIINVGDQIQVLSNGIFKSVEHRVMANSTQERLSVAFFYNPKNDVQVGPAPTLVTPDRPALYQPITFGDYRLYMRTKGPRGKSHVECLKLIGGDLSTHCSRKEES